MKLLIVFLLDFYDEYSYRILLKDLATDAYKSNIKTKRIHFLFIIVSSTSNNLFIIFMDSSVNKCINMMNYKIKDWILLNDFYYLLSDSR